MASPAILHGAESHIVRSEIMDFDFEITVAGPPVEWPHPLPVVYSTDANFGIGFGVNAATMLLMGGEIPPVLTVGIGYPVGADLTYVGTRRMYDLSPTSDEKQLESLAGSTLAGGEARGGGAPLFIRFMIEELWPWIAANYDVSEDRTYVGDSMGGLFGCYTLFNHPGFFNRYVIGSPWICWDHPLVFDYEERYAATHDDLDAVVFLSAGGAEDVISPVADPAMAATFKVANTQEYTERLGALLASRNYSNLELKTLIFPEETHFTVPFALVPHGMRYVFQAR